MTEPTGHMPVAELSDENRALLAQNWTDASAALDQVLSFNHMHRDAGDCTDWFCVSAELSDLYDSYAPHQLQMLLRVAVERLTQEAQKRDQVGEAVELLADLVAKCTEYGTQEGEFAASYLLPTGPVHRAIPWLQQRGITVRPGPGHQPPAWPSAANP